MRPEEAEFCSVKCLIMRSTSAFRRSISLESKSLTTAVVPKMPSLKRLFLRLIMSSSLIMLSSRDNTVISVLPHIAAYSVS